MRFHAKLAALALALVVVALTGCKSVPIQNVNQAPVTSASGKPLSRDQVRGAIVRAGVALGWQMKDEGPNMLVATLLFRSHSAVVEIPYSANNYSLKYHSSTNLDEKDGNIHRTYNSWVQSLTRGINAQLTAS